MRFASAPFFFGSSAIKIVFHAIKNFMPPCLHWLGDCIGQDKIRSMEADLIAQSVELESLPNHYDRVEFISIVKRMTNEEFNRFCREIRYLMFRYSQTAKGFVTWNEDLVKEYEDDFVEMPLIDFDAPVLFTREA